MGDFIEADTRAMVKLYTLYGRLHALDTGVTDNQLRAITFRTKSYLSYHPKGTGMVDGVTCQVSTIRKEKVVKSRMCMGAMQTLIATYTPSGVRLAGRDSSSLEGAESTEVVYCRAA